MKAYLQLIILIFVAKISIAQNYRTIEPYLTTITKYESFAAKAVDDYSLSIYQDSRKDGVRETLLTKLKEDRVILNTQMINVNKDTSYTEGLIEFIDLLIEYFEKNIGEFNIDNDSKNISYDELEHRFRLYNFYSDKIENKFIETVKLKEVFANNHGLPIVVDYSRDVYKNQFFRYSGKIIEIVAKIDFADIKLQNAINNKVINELDYNFEKLDSYLNEGKELLNEIGFFMNNDRMFLQTLKYIEAFEKYQNHNKSKIELVKKYNELLNYKKNIGEDQYYTSQANQFNNNRLLLYNLNNELLIEKSTVVTNFYSELNEFQREHLENLIENKFKIQNIKTMNNYITSKE